MTFFSLRYFKLQFSLWISKTTKCGHLWNFHLVHTLDTSVVSYHTIFHYVPSFLRIAFDLLYPTYQTFFPLFFILDLNSFCLFYQQKMSHTKEFHVANVDRICRLCLNLVKTRNQARRFKCNYYASDYMLQIYQVYGFDINNDVPGTHSKFFL